ncbi:zinc ribbon domain-containing protein [Vibrio coralliilyticus]|uniref:zinc ribbon domain-containing protein n=1 Tax=Vibrio coralliilyticus TaxID=190893 RepID=UPI00240A4222|nr:zinc ribbon domain-containing protein [Vibrio coralliilyticus]WFB47548.1 zinc ribbon domain-containing protein [Vibrio coralliilyticus]
MNLCPVCQKELEWQGHYHCNDCASDYIKVGYCPECEDKLEKLQACGSASYFCHTCNELKSKSRVGFQFIKQA